MAEPPTDMTQPDEVDALRASALNAEANVDEPDYLDEEEDEEERRPLHLIGLALVIVALIMILLLRLCGLPDTGSQGGAKQIIGVPEKHPLPGSISVWVAPGTSIDTVLSGIQSSKVTDLGQGRYVVDVTEGLEVEVVKALRERPGVYDAGLVYRDERPLTREDVEDYVEP
jgi:hypothetical protein